jgi:hypothetical protein
MCNLPIIPEDKANHFIYGLLIYFEYWNVILFLLGLSFDALRDGLFWSYIIE